MKRYLILLSLLLLAGCATNPVTGKNELSLVSEAQELAIGAQQFGPARQSQGGDYVVDRQLTAYVDEVGPPGSGRTPSSAINLADSSPVRGIAHSPR